METIIVITAVSLAFFFTVRSLYRTFSTKQEDGGCGCASGKSGCSSAGSCPTQQQIESFHSPTTCASEETTQDEKNHQD